MYILHIRAAPYGTARRRAAQRVTATQRTASDVKEPRGNVYNIAYE